MEKLRQTPEVSKQQGCEMQWRDVARETEEVIGLHCSAATRAAVLISECRTHVSNSGFALGPVSLAGSHLPLEACNRIKCDSAAVLHDDLCHCSQ